MRVKGTHTYDLFLEYCRCPSCGYVMESRKEYENRLGKLEKEIECNRCDHEFTVSKQLKPVFGPFFD
jgi:uncharacterized C2H2 Zn-finger protein